MELADFINCAKSWLLDYVENNTTLKNFEIVNKAVVKSGVCVFAVKYTWTLNGWEKNVEKDVYVIYNSEKKTFFTADI